MLDAGNVRRVEELLARHQPLHRLVLGLRKDRAFDEDALGQLSLQVRRDPRTRLELTGVTVHLAGLRLRHAR